MTIAQSLRDAISRDQLPPTNALHILREILADVPTLNNRRCWSCGQSHWHADSAVPHVLCPQCKSQDTRLIEIKEGAKP